MRDGLVVLRRQPSEVSPRHCPDRQVFSGGEFAVEMQEERPGTAGERIHHLHGIARRVIESVWLRSWNWAARGEVSIGAVARAVYALKLRNEMARSAIDRLARQTARAADRSVSVPVLRQGRRLSTACSHPSCSRRKIPRKSSIEEKRLTDRIRRRGCVRFCWCGRGLPRSAARNTIPREQRNRSSARKPANLYASRSLLSLPRSADSSSGDR